MKAIRTRGLRLMRSQASLKRLVGELFEYISEVIVYISIAARLAPRRITVTFFVCAAVRTTATKRK